MIELKKHIQSIYNKKKGNVEALKSTSLKVEKRRGIWNHWV